MMDKRNTMGDEASSDVTSGPPAKRPRLEDAHDKSSPSVTFSSKAPEQATAAASSFGFAARGGLFGSLVSTLGVRASTEPEVGITEYVDPALPPFEGIIKHRFTDFLVFEVGLDGQVLRLKSLDAPAKTATTLVKPSGHGPSENAPLWSEQASQVMRTLLKSDEARLSAFADFVAAGPSPVVKGKFLEDRRITTAPVEDKAERGTFHKMLREIFGGRIVSETKEIKKAVKEEAEEEETLLEQVIDVTWKSPGGKKERVSRAEKATQHPPYIHFTLLKSNRETHDALSHLVRVLHLQNRDLGSCGTKDKRAVTVQRISVKRGGKTLEDVWRAGNGVSGKKGKGAGKVWDNGVKLGDFEYAKQGLELGQLQGNRFVVTLRDVSSPDPTTIPLAITALSTKGFINYYGMQRFGTAPIPTHAVGLALLQSDWALATALLLCEREGEGEDALFARQLWKEGKVQEAMRNMPRRCVAERALLEHYHRTHPSDHLSALSKIPKNLRMMYVHAYQSYVFNRVVSERVRLFGADKPVVGDLVLIDGGLDAGDEAAEEETEAVSTERASESLDPDLDDDTPSGAAPAGPTQTSVVRPAFTAETAASHSRIAPARPLTQADLNAETHTIFDVVLPLPGYAVIYPEGQLGESYKRILAEDGLDIANLVRKQKEYSLGGTYRHLLHLPKDVAHELLVYPVANQDLAQSDADLLSSVPAPVTEPFDVTQPCPGGQHLALKVELTLGAGTFATMALRECMKTRTGQAAMKALTEQRDERLKEAEPAKEETVDTAA